MKRKTSQNAQYFPISTSLIWLGNSVWFFSFVFSKDIHLGGGLAVPLEISRQIFMQISTIRFYRHVLTCCQPLLLLAVTQTNTISKNLVSEHKHFQFYRYSCYSETFILWLNNSSCSLGESMPKLFVFIALTQLHSCHEMHRALFKVCTWTNTPEHSSRVLTNKNYKN